MSDGLASSITEAAKNTTKGFVKGAIQEVSQTLTQGASQVAGEQRTPEEMAQRISQMKQEDAQNTQAQIASIENQIRIERQNREQRQAPPTITESAKKPIVNLGQLVEQKRENKENKIAAA